MSSSSSSPQGGKHSGRPASNRQGSNRSNRGSNSRQGSRNSPNRNNNSSNRPQYHGAYNPRHQFNGHGPPVAYGAPLGYGVPQGYFHGPPYAVSPFFISPHGRGGGFRPPYPAPMGWMPQPPFRGVSNPQFRPSPNAYPRTAVPQSEQKLTEVKGPVFSIDVECVASGPSHNEREVAHVAMVDGNGQLVLNIYVKPEKHVFSYIEPLTGCNAELLSNGIPLGECVEQIKQILPKNAILVGQNILKDVQWLKLKEDVDFAGMLDLAGLYRVKSPKYKNWVYHSLHHKAKALLGISQGQMPHTANEDARMSVVLFNLYLQLERDPQRMALAKQSLLDTPLDPTFVKQNPSYEGACMGNRKTCTCGAPFFF